MSVHNRGLIEIMSEILAFTHEMAREKNDADKIVVLMEKRGVLMDEFDALRKTVPDGEFKRDEPELRHMSREMLNLGNSITDSLNTLKNNAKQELRDSTQQNRVLNYANRSVSASGSFMDIKE